MNFISFFPRVANILGWFSKFVALRTSYIQRHECMQLNAVDMMQLASEMNVKKGPNKNFYICKHNWKLNYSFIEIEAIREALVYILSSNVTRTPRRGDIEEIFFMQIVFNSNINRTLGMYYYTRLLVDDEDKTKKYTLLTDKRMENRLSAVSSFHVLYVLTVWHTPVNWFFSVTFSRPVLLAMLVICIYMFKQWFRINKNFVNVRL